MGRKSKVSYELKVLSVEKYIKENKSPSELANKLGISVEQFKVWVRKYKENGYESLRDNRGKRKNIDQMSETEKLNAQIRLLEAKNKQLEMENKFLKKLKEIERRR